MLRELDYIESDWAALFWAMGSTTAIFRYAVPRGFRAGFDRHPVREEELMGNVGRQAAGVISGVVIAVAVTVCAFSLVRLSFYLVPAWGIDSGYPWVEWISVIAIPEAIFILTAVAVWRRRRSMAIGILLSGITLITHFVVHLAAHG
jgi:hypothetical protein